MTFIRLALMGLLVVALGLTLGADGAAAHNCDPSGPDYDGDGLADGCDPAPLSRDYDGDGFPDPLELWVKTSPTYRCSFPPDIDRSGTVAGGDVFAIFPHWMTTPDDAAWGRRFDVDGSQKISAGDVFALFPVWLQTCSNAWHYPGNGPGLHSLVLHPETRDGQLSPHWVRDHAEIRSDEPGAFKSIYCNEFEAAADHWTKNTNFDFSVSWDGTGECDGPGNVNWKVAYWPSYIVAAVEIFGVSRQCTASNPCAYGHTAYIWMNALHSSNNSRRYRHAVLTHEFGHVVGLGDIMTCDSAEWTIMSGGMACIMENGLHWVPANDALFTDRKY